MISEEQLVHSIVQDCTVPIVTKDTAGNITSFNKSAEKMFGYEAAEILNQPIMTLVPGKRAEEEQLIGSLLSDGQCVRDLTTIRMHKDGHLIPVSLTAFPVLDADHAIAGTCHIIRHCPSDEAAEQNLLYLAFRDHLTGLSNRNHFLDRLNHVMQRDERTQKHAGILFIDLDNFKTVNDTAGHMTGDKLLKLCARRLQSGVREHDTIARWGGDEFVVLVDNLPENRSRAMEILEQISANLLEILRKPYFVNAEQFLCSATIGASLFRGLTHPVENAINQADRAMYKAKSSGKNAICVHRRSKGKMFNTLETRIASQAQG